MNIAIALASNLLQPGRLQHDAICWICPDLKHTRKKVKGSRRKKPVHKWEAARGSGSTSASQGTGDAAVVATNSNGPTVGKLSCAIAEAFRDKHGDDMDDDLADALAQQIHAHAIEIYSDNIRAGVSMVRVLLECVCGHLRNTILHVVS
jgi:hypothetical protein